MKVSLPDFNCANVLVVGDIMLDRYWYGGTNRISPEAPVPVVKIDSLEERPGGAANVAMNITSLCGNVRLIGLTGIDEPAKILNEQLSGHKVQCDFVSVSTHPTITKLRVLSRNQQLIRIDFEEGFNNIDATPLLERIQTALTTHKVLVLSDYAKGALSAVQSMIKLANHANVPILVDPKGTDFERYRGATLLTPNMSEFEAVVGHCKTEEEIVEKGYQLIKQYDLKALLVTRSEKGMTLLQLDKPIYHLPTQAKEVFDVTGAGDTVIATLAAALAAGQSLEESCFLANVAAGVVVGKLGTSTVSQVELSNAIRARANDGFGVMTEEELKEEIKKARMRGEKIVMTNGCFDILHAGHVSYLANARKLGDRLIVAVNSDASVKQLKGESRPINPLMQRMIVLGALNSVDWVVPFEEETPQRLIASILPDVLVKGGDYKPENIAGGKEVIEAGGTVKVLNFEDGCSTTNIINAIKNR
ncbi:bifunctional heptose 7-phosphate kinase/heptose 1-phosphate adenyltransferase [Gilliamella sp. Fer1-1]|jgi:D-beta-D-heptose 7-phosphate kinase / D-beta-D-heptose 1-phosphate adenosyltransferase|uniref:bifunctional D-glycero-beta-D-manno-heptose-7-phosphate kinase/D-glycero-beta-D-manno-heptose 1-phosphate adenylyltransferase HldE n=1 Tax=unclassified Gilliamella TaxID=2685620 RepID=UPI00080EC44A|nr:bifunctional D-glycero-beta-D-manno-heptose-7-phosphate kinase/D-glycero-beta-D-manno-heptose 1-phosphate adenylyltransferase HldE [Gilliamella apicola]OCG25748.1 bifunctional heptose 7-phosphate kinase/heptose 1-phosphate adenyltransferase [Gilliamella apicola]OCG28869.1 bifunctional heptose 7-phosphate kinase/heptose 1-phosphate adenyltransferase [Gilliamella apicola]OCG45397.1 bifunctional heptose 7-phosphate kinase/heptose 1-phosphate adenyltransferase [Gilliamella apicola]